MRILLICTGNSCRSQMAEGFLKSFDSKLEIFSAGTIPSGKIDDRAIKVMREVGVDISEHKTKNVQKFTNQYFDYVITLCDNAKEVCPQFNGEIRNKLHISILDPAYSEGTEVEQLDVYRNVRDLIKIKIYDLYHKQIHHGKSYFSKIAVHWDEIRKTLYNDSLREELIGKINLKEGEKAADLGCGTGFITEYLLQKGAAVTALDSAEEMLEIINDKFGVKVKKVQVIGDKLPVFDNTYDYVFGNMYLHHLQNPNIAIQEAVRILKPGGSLIISDFDTHELEYMRTEQHDKWLGFDRKMIEKWFKEAGLVDFAIEDAKDSTCKTLFYDEHDVKMTIFIAKGTKK